MLGAVLGDIIGSYYEWNNVKTKDFPFVTNQTRYTDDTVMTLAVAKWLLEDPAHSEGQLVRQMQNLGRTHIDAGYGGSFRAWLLSSNPQPYGSWGNGSAMRVSPVGLFADTESEARRLASLTAAVTHNHPEGIKGAEAVAVAVFLNRHHASLPLDFRKKMTKDRIEKLFGYDLDRTLDEIRPSYKFDVSCQGSVPEAIIAYLESESVEDCIRNAISIGGDSDTIAAIACSIFMAGKNSSKEENAWTAEYEKYLTDDLKSIMHEFERLWADCPKSANRVSPENMEQRNFIANFIAELDKFKQYATLQMWTNGLGHMGKAFNGEDAMPEKTGIATADSWSILPMPKEHTVIKTDIDVPSFAMDIIRKGHIPEDMADHWFMYCNNRFVRYYRSWTGICIYEARYSKTDNGYKITSLKVNRSKDQYLETNDRRDYCLFMYMLITEAGGDGSKFFQEFLSIK